MKFKFKLESVLSLKQNIEDIKKRELGLAHHEKEQIEQEKDYLNRTLQGTLLHMKENVADNVGVETLKQHNRYAMHLKQKIEDKQIQLEKAERKVEEKRQELIESVKQRKILENLKLLHIEYYRIEAKRQEQRLTDEIVSYQYTTRERGE